MGHRESSSEELKRVLATVLFPISSITHRAATMVDGAWRKLLANHDELVLHDLFDERVWGRS